jgi:hypothetical protein
MTEKQVVEVVEDVVIGNPNAKVNMTNQQLHNMLSGLLNEKITPKCWAARQDAWLEEGKWVGNAYVGLKTLGAIGGLIVVGKYVYEGGKWLYNMVAGE